MARGRRTSLSLQHPWRDVGRVAALFAMSLVALQIFFVCRVALMNVFNPTSTTFQRSEMMRMSTELGQVLWAHEWVAREAISSNLKRAVIASEDAGFVDHSGVEWDAIERAWERNEREASKTGARPAKMVGGSTITQQLAKNLFLSGERTALRKGQELVITYALENLLSKERILEVYLNNVEWGEGLFGAQMAARYYHRVDASRLSTMQAARLAVMLPAPRRFEKRPNSPYVLGRAATVAANMPAVELP